MKPRTTTAPVLDPTQTCSVLAQAAGVFTGFSQRPSSRDTVERSGLAAIHPPAVGNCGGPSQQRARRVLPVPLQLKILGRSEPRAQAQAGSEPFINRFLFLSIIPSLFRLLGRSVETEGRSSKQDAEAIQEEQGFRTKLRVRACDSVTSVSIITLSTCRVTS